MAQAPPRVEMRLRRSSATRPCDIERRRTAVVAAWTLAAAAVLVGEVGWINWRKAVRMKCPTN